MKRILILEPYYGGSHKNFLHGLQSNVEAEYVRLTLPARKWKLRMQLSAQWFVTKLEKLPRHQRHFDVVLSSTFVDLAAFKALVTGLDGWNENVRICLYLHENQFAYPNRTDDKARYQFMYINFNSALAADSLAFNSEFNRKTFLRGCGSFLSAASDMKMPWMVDELAKKSRVLYPGVDLETADTIFPKDKFTLPVIVWNHRWEHDKNPQEFFNGLYHLLDKGLEFKLIILGESFKKSPGCFRKARTKLSDKLIYFGYVTSHQEYLQYLSMGTIVVSTSLHEFYGISVIEAVRSGCYPVLPDRLSYPELFPGRFLYPEDGFIQHLETAVKENYKLTRQEAVQLTEKMSWNTLKGRFREWLLEGVESA